MFARRSLTTALSVAGALACVFAISVHPAAAAPSSPSQTPPQAPPQAPTGANPALGTVRVAKDAIIGWIAADGIVLTSSVVADSVGAAATFQSFGSSELSPCYVAKVVPRQQLAALRCTDLAARPLELGPRQLAAGTPASIVTIDQTFNPVSQAGTVVDQVKFMRHDQPRFSFSGGAASKDQVGIVGAPVISNEGIAVSMIFAVPESGALPLGLTTAQISDSLGNATELPDSFTVAAILSIGRRALIPMLVGVVIGALWAWRSPTGRVTKVLGPVFAAILGTVAVGIFQVLVIGPGALIG